MHGVIHHAKLLRGTGGPSSAVSCSVQSAGCSGAEKWLRGTGGPESSSLRPLPAEPPADVAGDAAACCVRCACCACCRAAPLSRSFLRRDVSLTHCDCSAGPGAIAESSVLREGGPSSRNDTRLPRSVRTGATISAELCPCGTGDCWLPQAPTWAGRPPSPCVQEVPISHHTACVGWAGTFGRPAVPRTAALVQNIGGGDWVPKGARQPRAQAVSGWLPRCKTGGQAHLEARVRPREGARAGGRLCRAKGATEAAGPPGQPGRPVPHRHPRAQTHLQRIQISRQALLKCCLHPLTW